MGEDMKIARVIITTECNKSCGYCCNKLLSVQNSFKMTTIDQFVKMGYDIVNITGGEPTLVMNKLIRLVNELSINTKVYLYSNELNSKLAAEKLKNISGVNIGAHNDLMGAFNSAMDYKEQGISSVRILIEDKSLTKEFNNMCLNKNIQIITWKLNECEKTKEDRWII